MAISEVEKDYVNPTRRYRCEWLKDTLNESLIFEEETLKAYVALSKP